MIEKMKEIIRKNDLCVLATVSEGRPHCSLMSYVSDDEAIEIYMVSHRESMKYINLTLNPAASLLIDTREDEAGRKRSSIKALTIRGEFRIFNDPGRKNAVRLQLLKRHPHLAGFLDDPGAEIFCIRAKSFQLLDGPKDAFIETIE